VRLRLAARYALTIAALVFVTAFVLSTALYQQQRRFSIELEGAATATLSNALQQQAMEQGVALARSLADEMIDAIYHQDLTTIAEDVADTRVYPGVISVRVLDHRGRIVSDGTPANEHAGQQTDEPWLRPVFEAHRPRIDDRPDLLKVAMPVMAGSVMLGIVTVETSWSPMVAHIDAERAKLVAILRRGENGFFTVCVVLSMMLLIGAMLAAAAVGKGLAEPIQILARRARQIGRGKRDVPSGIHRGDEVGDLARAFDEMATALRQTTVSKDYVDNILQSMAEMLIVTDASQRIVTANRACLAELQCTEDLLRGLPISTLLPEIAFRGVTRADGAPAGDGAKPGNRANPPHDDGASAAAGNDGASETKNGEGNGIFSDDTGATWFSLTRPGGGTLPVQVSVAPLRERGDDSPGSVYVMQNVAAHLAAREQSLRSLQEKEILLKEIHHRVKNNLQIISSMLSLQANRSIDDVARNIFLESENRIRAMALIHEQLYRSGDLARVDMRLYVQNLSTQIVRSIGNHGCVVEVEVDSSLREVPVDVAIPLGLIVNELLSNAVRHAFPASRTGKVHVRLRARGQQHELEVSDDGVGLSPAFNADSLPTLGLKLVRALVEQLRGTLEIVGTATAESGTGNGTGSAHAGGNGGANSTAVAAGATFRALFPASAVTGATAASGTTDRAAPADASPTDWRTPS